MHSHLETSETNVRFVDRSTAMLADLATRLPQPDEGPDDVAANIARVDRMMSETHSFNQISLVAKMAISVDDFLERAYGDLRSLFPFDRLSYATVEEDRLIVRWARAATGSLVILPGYQGPLSPSLAHVVATETPRIVDDLTAIAGPTATSATKDAISEGIRSSLTCPVIGRSVAPGLLFLSSTEVRAFDESHVATYQRISDHLAVVAEREFLQEMMGLRDRFLGIAAHDLRNPLGAIGMAVEIIPTVDDALRTELIGDIGEQVEFMRALIDQFLEISSIQAGKIDISAAPTGAQGFISECVKRAQRVADGKGTTIVIAEATAAAAMLDAVKARQVVDNLLSNAVKYSPGGSTVTVRHWTADRWWVLEVEDEGPGISESDEKRLFQYFAKLGPRPTSGESSTGLGLAISKATVEAHGGEIGYARATSGGSVFHVRIPLP